MASKTQQRITRWIIALVYTGLIYTLAWYVNPTWSWLAKTMGVEDAGNFVNRAVPAVGIVVLVLLLIRYRLPKPSSYIWLLAVVAGYAYFLTLHAEYPVERVHLIQYSLVAFVYFRAVRLDLSNRFSYTLAAVAVGVIGWTDELIQQYFIENRSGTLDDMIMNWAAGALGLVGLLAIRREGIWDTYARTRPAVRAIAGYALPILLAGFWSYEVYTRYLYPPLNLLIITVDCARPDRMSAYGNQRQPPTTDFLDEYAAQGAVFTNAFSQAAWTGPGVLSTLTGMYPSTHGVDGQGKTLPKAVYTLLDAFKERGYRVPDLSYLTVDPTFQNLGDMEPTGIDVTTKNEIAAINQWFATNNREPVAMWYHWRFAHLPYDPPRRHWVYEPAKLPEGQKLRDFPQPERIRNLIRREVIIPYFDLDTLENPEQAAALNENEVPPSVEFTEEEREWIDALYDAQMRHFDYNFESLRYRLALHHKQKNTIIIITADHGEELLEHGFIGHGSTAVHSRHYDEHLHIPLIIMCPRIIKEGRKIDVMAQQIDILPTVFDMMGWDIPGEVQGRSLLPAMLGEPMEDVPAFAESVEGGYQSKPHQRSEFVRSIRTKEWKFIARMSPHGNDFKLFNIVDDPGETKNVFVEYPHIAGEFIQQLGEWITMNLDARMAVEAKEAERVGRIEALDPANLSVPEIVKPNDGDTIYYETMDGSVEAEWTGNPHAAYVIEYDVGEGWHRLKGKYPVESGTEQIFGPIPKDGWKPLYQWNPYKVRVRPRDLPDGWSDWITINVAPVGAREED